MAAAVALLDRGWGKPVQAIAPADDATSLTCQHLVAMRGFSDQLAAERQPRTINGARVVEGGVVREANESRPAPPDLMAPALE